MRYFAGECVGKVSSAGIPNCRGAEVQVDGAGRSTNRLLLMDLEAAGFSLSCL